MRLLAAVLLGSTVVGYGVPAALAQAQRPAAPGTDCLDARQVAELHQAGARTLAVAERDGRLFRLQLSQDCPHLAAQPDASLVAANGWVCNCAQASVSTGQQRCAIDQVATLNARDYASLARQRDHDGVPTLDGISVREARRRNFAGSSSDCVNPSMLRSWSEDAQGLAVEVSPRHPGTRRHYRVELTDSCRELGGAPTIRFVSGMGLNAICGNPGDKVDVLDAIGIAGARVGAGAEGDLSSVRRHVLAHAAELHGGGRADSSSKCNTHTPANRRLPQRPLSCKQLLINDLQCFSCGNSTAKRLAVVLHLILETAQCIRAISATGFQRSIRERAPFGAVSHVGREPVLDAALPTRLHRAHARSYTGKSRIAA